jgi:hypothetical protein
LSDPPEDQARILVAINELLPRLQQLAEGPSEALNVIEALATLVICTGNPSITAVGALRLATLLNEHIVHNIQVNFAMRERNESGVPLQ